MKAIIEFVESANLWANIVGGIVAAVVLGIIAWVWRQYREWRVRQLGDLMGRIIEHRNAGVMQFLIRKYGYKSQGTRRGSG